MRETIGRALRRQRVAVAVAVAVGLLWGLAAGLARTSGQVALLTLVPLVALLWSLMRAFGKPGAGDLRADEREHAFFVPPTGRLSYRWVLLAFLTYTTASQLASDREDLWWIYPALAGPLAVLLAVLLWRRVPSVTLTPAGIEAGHPLQQVRVPWEALDPAVPSASYRHSNVLRLPVRSRDQVRIRGIGSRRHTVVETGELDVAPDVLARVS
ncbi:hypothetical protein ACWENR_30165 [Micromonospora sp. NPDC004336]